MGENNWGISIIIEHNLDNLTWSSESCLVDYVRRILSDIIREVGLQSLSCKKEMSLYVRLGFRLVHWKSRSQGHSVIEA